jgi:two-component system response regulator FixJ
VFLVGSAGRHGGSVATLLARNGWRVRLYRSAEEFLATPTFSEPGVVVTDTRMPGMGGEELLGELARRGVDSPVILLAGDADVAAAVRALRAGAFDYLEQPVNASLLAFKIASAVGGRGPDGD